MTMTTSSVTPTTLGGDVTTASSTPEALVGSGLDGGLSGGLGRQAQAPVDEQQEQEQQQRRRRWLQQCNLSPEGAAPAVLPPDGTLTPRQFRRAAELLARCWPYITISAAIHASNLATSSSAFPPSSVPPHGAADGDGGASSSRVNLTATEAAALLQHQQQPWSRWTLGESMRHGTWEVVVEGAGEGEGEGKGTSSAGGGKGIAAAGAACGHPPPGGLLTSAYLPGDGGGEGRCWLVMRQVPHHGPAAGTSATATITTSAEVHVQPEDPASAGLGEDGVVVGGDVPGGQAAPHLYDLRVALHPTYRVPTLYLSGKRTDGSPLGWQDMERDFPEWQRMRDHLLGQAPWALLAPAEDDEGGFGRGIGGAPHRGTPSPPSLMLHPCGTADVMRVLMGLAAADRSADGGCLLPQSPVEHDEEVPDIDAVAAQPEQLHLGGGLGVDGDCGGRGGGEGQGPRSAQERPPRGVGGSAGASGLVDDTARSRVVASDVGPGTAEERVVGDGDDPLFQMCLDLALVRYMPVWLATVAGPVLGLKLSHRDAYEMLHYMVASSSYGCK